MWISGLNINRNFNSNKNKPADNMAYTINAKMNIETNTFSIFVCF